MNEPKKKNPIRDLLLVGALLLIALALLLFTRWKNGQEEGAVAVVSINGEEAGRYPLSKNGVFPLNGGTNILVIEAGEAWVSEADCPDQICMGMGRISKNAEFIACLPNRVLIVIEGGEETGLDATA